MKLSTKSILLLTASVALMFCGERASAQSNTSQAVQHVQSGNKVFLEINATQLESELNQLFQSVASSDSAAQSISWGDVLGNGANPGMDINFSSYDITGLGGLTSTGTLAADSLTLAKDAAITGRLSVLDAVSFGDSLTVSGFVEFSDSLEVVKAVTIGETLYVTGVTSLGDSVHVAGNVDLDALFNVDGAATFGSTMTVSGETTLNDSLHVNSGVDIEGLLSAGSLGAPNLFVDSIAPFNGTDLTLATTSSTLKMTEQMIANYPEFAEAPAEELAFLLGNNTGIHSQSVSRATHVGALDTRTAAIQSDVALGRVQASATLLDWTATSDVAGDFVTESGQISPAAGLGFPAEALESTFFLQNIQQIPSGFLGAGRYASNPEVTNPELAGQGIDQAIWAQDTLLLQSGYNSDDNVMKSTLFMVEEGIVVSGNSFDVTGETTLNDSLHVNSGMDVSGDLVVNDTNLLQIIASLEARIAALESDGETPQEAFTCGTNAVTFDGHDYSTVAIGDQCWFAENLRTTQYADGSAILEVTDGTAWKTTNYAARVAYNNDPSNVSTYGYLYNWHAVDSAAGLCPSGWHVPTDAEWTTLTTALGGEGVKMKSSASDTPSWDGTNSSGFSALPGGLRYDNSGIFSEEGSRGYWWSASPLGDSNAWFRQLSSDNDLVSRSITNPRSGFSVRCLRDE